MRTVAAAKSWLAHHGVDRRSAILPWGAPDTVPRLSPVEASRRYLEHLAAAWHARHPDAPLGEQLVVLAVPASFDASARELTREAALAAGLPETTILIEEPQAAFYAWLADAGDRWRERLAPGDVVLVADIGGGTTDFTLVSAEADRGALALRRVAVGDHILVGGDNMDLALAHHVSARLAADSVRIDAWQSVSLWHACRTAKEALLGTDAPREHTLSVAGRGSRLIGGSHTVALRHDEVERILVDGFFPDCPIDAVPEHGVASGFHEVGLPFEADPAITRHLAHFLARHAGAARPTHLLCNGGCFKATRLRARLLEALGSWLGPELRPLVGQPDLDFAVARGAAHYAWTREHGGVRISGGVGRSYYVGVESSGLAVPGVSRPLRAMCIVPFGMEEGASVEVPGPDVGLAVGKPARFRFFGSTVRQNDRPGTLLPSVEVDDLVETDVLETELPATEDTGTGFVPVRFEARLTELGVLELWCLSASSERRSDQRWKLEFGVREPGDRAARTALP
jgi:hypothetical protein